MDVLFLKICGVAAGLVGLVVLSVHVIRHSAKFLPEEDDDEELFL